MRPQALARGSAVTLTIVLASCGSNSSQGGRSPRVTRTDSAGTEIVTTETAAADVPVFATLDSAPGLRIGSLDGPKEEQFGSVTSLAPLADGGIAVLDAQAKEIRIFGPDGAYVRTVGRAGEGPGELSTPRGLAALGGDTLAVYDWRGGRITFFAPDGRVGRTATAFFQGYGQPYRVSFFADGSIVGQSGYSGGRGIVSGEKPTFVTDSAVLVFSPTDGSPGDTVDILQTGESVRSMHRSGQGVMVLTSTAAFERSNSFAASPDGVWSGYGDRYAVRLLDPSDGHAKRIVRAPGLDRPLTDEEVNAVKKAELADADTPERLRAAQQVIDLSPRPAMRPAFDRMLVDDGGRLWLRDWPGADTDTRRWWVFARDGGLLGSVVVPGKLRLMAIQNGHAWGIVHDELDVPYVVRYTMHAVGA
jgi:hypothetical protein